MGGLLLQGGLFPRDARQLSERTHYCPLDSTVKRKSKMEYSKTNKKKNIPK